MQESKAIIEAMAAYWANLGRADAAATDGLITKTGPAIVVGTGPGEGRDGPDEWRAGYRDTIEQMPGVSVEAGVAPRAYEENGVGFLSDEPTWILPDGTRIPTRVTTVWHQENGTWRVVHLHLSLGVPDELMGTVVSAQA